MSNSRSRTKAEVQPVATASRALKAFVLAVDALAVLALVGLLSGPAPGNWVPLVALGAVGLLAGVASVRLPRHQTRLVPTEPFVLAGLGLIGPWGAVVVAIAPVVGRAMLGRTRAVQLAFNLGASVIAAVGASLAFFLSGGVPGAAPIDLVVPVIVAGAAFFAINSSLVAGALSLHEGRSWLRTLKRVFLGTVPANMAGPLLALALFVVIQAGLGWMLVVAVPVLGVTFVLLRAHATRLSAASGGA